MKKTTILQILVFVVFAIMLIPIPFTMKDGGTKHYNAILWDFYDVHRATAPDDYNDAVIGNEFIEGKIIVIFGIEVFNNTDPYIESEILTGLSISFAK